MWDDALENLKSPDSSELFGPAGMVFSSLSMAGIPFLLEHDAESILQHKMQLTQNIPWLLAGCQTSKSDDLQYNLARKVLGLIKGKRNCILEMLQDPANMLGQLFC